MNKKPSFSILLIILIFFLSTIFNIAANSVPEREGFCEFCNLNELDYVTKYNGETSVSHQSIALMTLGKLIPDNSNGFTVNLKKIIEGGPTNKPDVDFPFETGCRIGDWTSYYNYELPLNLSKGPNEAFKLIAFHSLKQQFYFKEKPVEGYVLKRIECSQDLPGLEIFPSEGVVVFKIDEMMDTIIEENIRNIECTYFNSPDNLPTPTPEPSLPDTGFPHTRP